MMSPLLFLSSRWARLDAAGFHHLLPVRRKRDRLRPPPRPHHSRAAVAQGAVGRGGTRLHDGLYAALALAGGQKGLPIVVALTDGRPGWHRLEVKLKGRSWRRHARGGYLAATSVPQTD